MTTWTQSAKHMPFLVLDVTECRIALLTRYKHLTGVIGQAPRFTAPGSGQPHAGCELGSWNLDLVWTHVQLKGTYTTASCFAYRGTFEQSIQVHRPSHVYIYSALDLDISLPPTSSTPPNGL